MTTNSSVLGHPGIISFENGQVSCKTLTRSAIQGDATRYKENLLQQLIADNPGLLPIKDFLPTTSALFSLGREISVDVGGHAGYIDNLLISNEGQLVLVETKLWRNPESIREVIAQTLQYGMALSALSIRDLERKLPILKGQSISDFLQVHHHNETVVDDFEYTLEKNLRRGELLYLIVSDGIRVSAERITHWLNDGGSAPFKFGMVELRFFESDNNSMLVVPRTLLKTREISRHVVVVDVQGQGAASAVAQVWDESKTPLGIQTFPPRPVKVARHPITKERLITDIKLNTGEKDSAIASRIFQYLDDLDLQTRLTPSNLQYGIALDDAPFYPLISFNVSGAWSQPFSTLIDMIGDDEFVAHKLRMNNIGAGIFYRQNEVTDPAKRRNALEVKYSEFNGKEAALGQAIATTRDTVTALRG